MRSPAGGPDRSSRWPWAWPSPSPCCGPNPMPWVRPARSSSWWRAAVLATWPVNGRTGDQWLPVVVRWGARRSGWRGLRRMDSLGGLRLLSVGSRPDGRRARSAGEDPHRRPLPARPGIRPARSRRAGAEGGGMVLRPGHPGPRGLARSAASSGWRRRFPDQGHGVRSYLSSHATVDPASACVASYEGLLSDMEVRCAGRTMSCWPCRCACPSRSMSAPRRCSARWRRWPACWPTPISRWTAC